MSRKAERGREGRREESVKREGEKGRGREGSRMGERGREGAREG